MTVSNLVIGDYTAAATTDGSTHYLLIQPGSSSTAYRKINRNVLLGVTGQPADISTIQTFSNKILDNTNTITVRDGVFTLQDDVDLTKQARFQLSGITTATTRTYTLPNASSTLADISTTQTFANKTLTAPAITGGTIDNSTITVDAIGEHTVNNGVTIDGLNIMNGALNTNNSVVTANITDGAVTPAKLVTGTGSGWTWATWSPSYTNLTIGNGTVEAKYIQIGKTVFGRWLFVLGTSSVVGSAPTISLPVAANSSYYTTFGNATIGQARYVTGGAGYEGVLTMNSAATSSIPFVYNVSGTYATDSTLTATAPNTWGAGNTMTIVFSYEVA